MAIDAVIASPDARAEGFGQVNPGRLSLMASQVSDAFNTKTRVKADEVWNGSFLPTKAELNVLPAGEEVSAASGTAFIDFRDVWLAYNDELLAAGQFAVEAIDLQVDAGRVHRHRRAFGLRQVHLHEAGHRAAHAVARPHPHRRPAGHRAAEDLRHGVPGAFAAALAHDGRQRAAAAGDRRALPQQLQGKRKEYEERARALLRKVGLAGYEDKFPWQLSGGMQQRASICRALIHEPKMLLLDEPFGALDAFTREELWCILRDLWTEQRFNVILVTHDLRESVFLADTVYVMSKSPGRFVVKQRDRPAAPARAGDHLHQGVHRHRARTARAHRRHAQDRSGGGAMKPHKHFERWAPVLLAVALVHRCGRSA